jgi:hypothetical protein
MPMRRLIFVALIGTGSFAQSGPAVNEWIQHGPEGGIARRPVIDPQNRGTMYVAAGSRQYRRCGCTGFRIQFHSRRTAGPAAVGTKI